MPVPAMVCGYDGQELNSSSTVPEGCRSRCFRRGDAAPLQSKFDCRSEIKFDIAYRNDAGLKRVVFEIANAFVPSRALSPKAVECEREAERAPSPVTAEAWLKMAKKWRDLADQIQRYDRPNSP
jgi:hypothetical protein